MDERRRRLVGGQLGPWRLGLLLRLRAATCFAALRASAAAAPRRPPRRAASRSAATCAACGPLLQLALGLVLLAAVDAPLAGGEGVDLEARASACPRCPRRSSWRRSSTSTPSFFRRSMTSWLGRSEIPRELEDPNVHHPAPLLGSTPAARPPARPARALPRSRSGGSLGVRLRLRPPPLPRLRRARFRRRPRPASAACLGRRLLPARPLGLEPRRLLGVALSHSDLGVGGRLADLLGGLGPDALDLSRSPRRSSRARWASPPTPASISFWMILSPHRAPGCAARRPRAAMRAISGLDLLALLFLALDVDAPAHELGREPDVLALLADGEARAACPRRRPP